MYACLYQPPALDAYSAGGGAPARVNKVGAPQRHPEAESLRSRPRECEALPARGGGAPREIRNVVNPLVALARDFSPRYERHRDDLVSIDVSGLGRLLGPMRAIGEELRREAAARGLRVHVALAGTRMAALVLVHARPGLTLVEPGEEAEA